MCTIKVRFIQASEKRGVFGYAFSAEVLSAEGVSPKIFVFHQYPAGIDGNTTAEFDHVASPVDLSELPEDAASETVPWYRTDKCTIWVRSVDDLELTKQLFVDDIAGLQRSLELLTSEESSSKQTTLEFSNGGAYATVGEEKTEVKKNKYEPVGKPDDEWLEDRLAEAVDLLAQIRENKKSSNVVDGQAVDSLLSEVHKVYPGM